MLSLQNGNDDPSRKQTINHFFDQPVKNKQTYEKLVEILRKNYYPAGNYQIICIIKIIIIPLV